MVASLQINMSSVDVIWTRTRLSEQLLEELLVVDASHTADLLHLGFFCRVSVDEVGRDADSQLSSQLLVSKTCGKEEKEETALMMKAHFLNMAAGGSL